MQVERVNRKRYWIFWNTTILPSQKAPRYKMISKDSLNLEWLHKVSSTNNKADLILIEKVVRALLLLEGLVESGLDFVFKGGTALMLHMKSSKRLSIDIDIVIQDPIELQQMFNKISGEKGFIRVEEQKRTVNYAIQKAHYKFYYNPTYKTAQEEDYVLMDILSEQPQYANLVALPIESLFVQQEGQPLHVNVPSLNDLLGDKLTAFAPNTTGIPYMKGGNSKAMEIIKQLYDTGNLFDLSSNLEVIASTFQKFAIVELGYRDMGDDWTIVLDDIYQTALLLSTRGFEGTGDLEALLQGIRQIKGYIFSESYSPEKAVIHASKAAYISVLIRRNQTSIERFGDPLEMAEWVIEQPFCTKLNKLKKSNPEAFFYWYKIYLLEKV